MAAITHVGNHLLVIRGEMRGQIGEVVKIKHLGHGLIDYVMLFDEDENDHGFEYIVPADDCSEYNPGSINLESPFDITNYLSVNEMKDIAKKIYISKITSFLDDVFANRSNVCGNIPAQVLNEIIEHYASDMFDKYKDDMLKIFKNIIESDTPIVNDENEKCFSRSIQWALEKCASKYIEEHPDELHETMKDQIHESAKRMIEEKWSYNLNKAIEKTITDFIESFKSNPDNKE